MSEVTIHKEELIALVTKKLVSENVSKDHAEVVADVLVHADLRGVHSHGVLRTEHYVKRLNSGGMNPSPKFLVTKKGMSSAIFDGDHGLGHVIMKEAMDLAITLSKKYGIGIVGIVNSSHCGPLSYFAEQAADEEIISMIMTQTDTAVVPFGSAQPYFGTNPIAYGFPALKNKPIILDMATSNVALGKVYHAREKGEAIPDNWGVDDNGKSVTDPHLLKHLLPIAGPKGYGLALAVDVLTGILTGSSFGLNITPYGDYENYRRLGHLIITIDPGLFIQKEEFLLNIDQMIDEIHSLKPSEGFTKVMVPGEPEQIKESEQIIKGIPISNSVYEYLLS